MKYTIKITTKGAHDIACCSIDFVEGANVEKALDSITIDDVVNWDIEPHDGLDSVSDLDYLGAQCMGDEFEGHFDLEVLDEDENVVFKGNHICDVRMVDPRDFLECIDDYYEDENERPDEELLQRMQKVMLEKYEEDKGDVKWIQDKYCVVVIDEMKWQEIEFEVEDDEFDPNKLLFINNIAMAYAYFDSYTDPNHVMYGDKILEMLETPDGDSYGTTYYLAKRTEHWFEIIRELD